MKLHIKDETAQLKTVILGIADSFGGTPELDETYDPSSRHHVREHTFPTEDHLLAEIASFEAVLKKHGVEVLRPMNILRLNQIYARDIGFVIDNTFVISNVIADRHDEIKGIEHILKKIDPERVLQLTPDVRIEGGDVIVWRNHLFVGYSDNAAFKTLQTARTNLNGIDFLKTHFPHYQVHPLRLIKSDADPNENALHLDCCFQPIGDDLALVCPDGFLDLQEYQAIIDYFGNDNLIMLDKKEMNAMMSNLFSISPQVVVSEISFNRINDLLTSKGMTVETVRFREVRKMSGLFRCCTLPLERG